jgi:hypothetical protein
MRLLGWRLPGALFWSGETANPLLLLHSKYCSTFFIIIFFLRGVDIPMFQKLPINALLSLTSIEALAVLTSVHHLDELGIIFLGPALIVVILPLVLIWQWTRKPGRPLLWVYGIYLTLMILGFGLYDGFFNHTLKMTIFFLYGAKLSAMRQFPFFPPVGSPFHEVTGVLTFVVTLYAVYRGYTFLAPLLSTASPGGKRS